MSAGASFRCSKGKVTLVNHRCRNRDYGCGERRRAVVGTFAKKLKQGFGLDSDAVGLLAQRRQFYLTDGSANENLAPPSALFSARNSPPCSRTMP